MSGHLICNWEAHCARCERPVLGLAHGKTREAAEAELLIYRWSRHDGKWHCPFCIEAEDPGHE